MPGPGTEEAATRIIINANAPFVPTGYGVQAHLIGRTLRDLGHEVAYSAFYGLQNGIIEWDGFRIYPGGLTEWGHDIVDLHARHFQADGILTIQDVWVLSPDLGHRGFPWVALVPIDSEPVAEGVLAPLRTSAHTVVAYSKWGQDQLRAAGVEAAYIPHGYDPAAYHPVTPEERRVRRDQLGFPDEAFLVGMVAANKGWPSRKGFDLAFDAVARFAEECPEVGLFLYTMSGSQYKGPNLQAMAQSFGIAGRTRFANPYYQIVGLEPGEMRTIYAAFDVLLAPSYGEGFGVPVLEAQASGTPVIVTDFGAQAELCGAGWAVAPARRWWTPLGNFMQEPSVAGIVAALHRARREAAGLREQAAAFALRYAQPRLERDYWAPFMADLERRILGPAAGAGRRAPSRPAIADASPVVVGVGG